jgi:uncharacterized protein (TIGR02588 family)
MEKHTKAKAVSTRGGSSTGRKRGVPQIPPVEWAVAALGLVLVAGTAVLLAFQAYSSGSSPPDITLRVESIVELRNGYVAKVKAVNVGGGTAADVIVEGELANASGVVEKSEMSFQYLPPHSARTGGLFFRKDPRQFEVRLTAKGYESP